MMGDEFFRLTAGWLVLYYSGTPSYSASRRARAAACLAPSGAGS